MSSSANAKGQERATLKKKKQMRSSFRRGCLFGVSDRNVWLATNLIVFFQTEGY